MGDEEKRRRIRRNRWEFFASLVLLLVFWWASRYLMDVMKSNQKTQSIVIVIDPGHGGADPGKIGVDQVKEKDVNLSISKKVKKVLEHYGITAVLTRTEDVSLSSESASNKKREDMKKRVSFINEKKPQLVISIHQNSYHDARVKGGQVFYFSKSEEGQKAAICIQKALGGLCAENTRTAQANDSYYLLRKTTVPTVIVECGFLTNAEEARLLMTEEYQEKIAETICTGVLDYLDK